MGTTEAATLTGRRAISINEACEQLGCSESFLRSLLRTGELQYRKLGRRIFIPVEAIDRFLLSPATEDQHQGATRR